MKRLLAVLLFLAGPAYGQTWPFPLDQYAVDVQVSANGVSNHVFTSPLKTVRSLTVLTGASAGFIMLIDGTALPSNGAVTACTTAATTRPCVTWCSNIAANSTLHTQWSSPLRHTSGVVAGFSTGANCDTLTASTTAKFIGQTP